MQRLREGASYDVLRLSLHHSSFSDCFHMISSEMRQQSEETPKDTSDAATIHSFHLIDRSSKRVECPLSFLRDCRESKEQEAKLLIMKQELRTDGTLLLEEDAPLNLYHRHIDDIIESMGWSQPLRQPDPPQHISRRPKGSIVVNTHGNEDEDVTSKLDYDEAETPQYEAIGTIDREVKDMASKLDYDTEEALTLELTDTHDDAKKGITAHLKYDEEETPTLDVTNTRADDCTYFASKRDYDEEEIPTLDCNKSYPLPPDYQIRRHDVLVDCRESPGYRRFRVVAAMRIERYLNGGDVFQEMLDAVRQAGGSFVQLVKVDDEKDDGNRWDDSVSYIDIGNNRARELALHVIMEALMCVPTGSNNDVKAPGKSKVDEPIPVGRKVDIPLPNERKVDEPPFKCAADVRQPKKPKLVTPLPKESPVDTPLPKEFTRPIPTRLNNLRYIPRLDTTGESYPLPEDYVVKAHDVIVGLMHPHPGNVIVGLMHPHPGNARFKLLARMRAERYRVAVSRLEKQSMIDEVVLDIRNAGAHFVRLEDGVFYDIGDHKARERTIYELKKAVIWWEKQNPDKVAPPVRKDKVGPEVAASVVKETSPNEKNEVTIENKSDSSPMEEVEKPTRRVTFLGNELSEADEPSDILKAIQELTSLKRPRTLPMAKDNVSVTDRKPSTVPLSSVKKPRVVSSAPLDNAEDDAALRERAKEDLRIRSESSRSRPTRFRKGLPPHVIEALTKRTRKPTSGRSHKRIKRDLGPSNGNVDGTDTGNKSKGVGCVAI
jgi:hypothetical protein